MEILENHKDQFGIDFKDNKKNLEQISIIRSKGLKNEIAGYITKFLKHELLDKKKQEERIAKQEKIDEESPEENLDMPASTSNTEAQSDDVPTEGAPQELASQNSEN